MTATALLFDMVRPLVESHCGVVLEADKEYLMECQVEPRLDQWGFQSLAQLAGRLREEPAGDLARQVVECLIPNETYFFRDPALYTALEKTILPGLLKSLSSKKEIRIWSAACSSGQEPYSLVMMLKEKFPFLCDGRLRILATDFSRQMIERAQAGRYNQTEIKRGLPPELLSKYFSSLAPGVWEINTEIRKEVEFRQKNLMEDVRAEGTFDLLLVRNVLIYFDIQTKKRIFAKLRQAMNPDGILFLGASETALFLDNALQGIAFDNSITGYRLKGKA